MGKTKRSKTKLNLLKHWPLLVIFLVVFFFAFPYWAHADIPFPANHLVTAFPPWQYYYGLPVKNNAMPDVVTQMYPWKHLAISMWKNGQMPLWNPYNFSGNPFLGNFQSAVFHPFNFLFFLLPEIDAWSLMILFQPLLAGFFTYLFCRQLKLSQAAALVSSIAFMFSGFITVWMAYGTMAHALLWLPLALFAIEKNFPKVSPGSLILLSLSLVASLFSGHIQTSFYVFSLAFFYLVFRLITSRQVKNFIFCLIALILGLALAAVQILPTLELYRFAVRSRSFGLSEVIPWAYLVNLLAPDFYGNPVTRNDWFGHYAEWSGFTGVIPLLLAIYVILKKRNKFVWFFLLVAIYSLASSLPTPLLGFLVKLKLPIISNSAASRIMSIFSFSIAILAGFGFDELKKDLVREKFKNLLFPLLAGVLPFLSVWLVLLFFKPIPWDKLFIAKRNFILPTTINLVFVGLVVGYFLLKGIVRRKGVLAWVKTILLFIVVGLEIFDLFRFSRKFVPFDPKEHVYPSVPVVEFLTKVVKADRLFGYFGMEMQNYYRLSGFNGYDPLYLGRYGQLLLASEDGIIKEPWIRGVSLGGRGAYTIKLLNLLGGKYVLHARADDRFIWTFPFWEYPEQFKMIYEDDKYEVYENLEVFPRAFIAADYDIAQDPQEIVNKVLKQSDLSKTIVLEENPIVMIPKTKENVSSTEITSYEPNKIEIQARSEQDGLLFLSDNYYPGWRALVDGKETKIYRADYSFRAIAFPEGDHQVVFIYDPLSFKIGLVISLFSLGGVILLGLMAKRRENRNL